MSSRRRRPKKKRAGLIVGVRLDGTHENPLHINGLVDVDLQVPDHVLIALIATLFADNGGLAIGEAVKEARELVRQAKGGES